MEFTDEQAAFRDTLHDFLDKESPIEVVRSAEPLGFDPKLWHQIVDLGLPAVAIPEALGGGGAGIVELVIAAECLGRYLAPAPFAEAAVANNLVAHLGTEGRSEISALTAQTVSGELLATLAFGRVVEGVAKLVPAGAVADLVVALIGDELVAFRSATGPDNSTAAVPNLGALPLGHCRFDRHEGLVLCSGPEAVAAYRLAVSQWRVLTGAALVGLGLKALEIGVDYVMQRKAFGVLLATFQTIQHRLADDATELDGAQLLVYEAAWALDENLPNAQELATMAFLFASQSAFKTASDSLHFHGGYGYTLEYDIQLYFRRAKAWPLVAGDPQTLHADLAHRLYDPKGR